MDWQQVAARANADVLRVMGEPVTLNGSPDRALIERHQQISLGDVFLPDAVVLLFPPEAFGGTATRDSIAVFDGVEHQVVDIRPDDGQMMRAIVVQV
jgi:hypothetical protein